MSFTVTGLGCDKMLLRWLGESVEPCAVINLPINATDGLLTCNFSLLTLNPDAYSCCRIRSVACKHPSLWWQQAASHQHTLSAHSLEEACISSIVLLIPD